MRRSFCVLIISVLAAAVLCGCARQAFMQEGAVSPSPVCSPAPTATAAPAEPLPTPEPTPFTLAWMSDTQHYSNGYLEYFTAMTDWIAKYRYNRNIAYVVHTGDVVGTCSKEYTWKNADAALSTLRDADIPVFMLAGNHDSYSARTKDFTRYLEFRKNYLEDNELTYRGGLCTCATFSAGGQDFVFVGISCNVLRKDPPAVAWVNAILAQYPDRIAILCFHSYMNANRALVADGVTAYNDIIAKNSNVRLVLAGHCRGVSHKISQFDDDGDGIEERTVDQLMMNYQGTKRGGQGYLVLLEFFPADGRMDVAAYSPFLDDYGYYADGRDIFTVKDVF